MHDLGLWQSHLVILKPGGLCRVFLVMAFRATWTLPWLVTLGVTLCAGQVANGGEGITLEQLNEFMNNPPSRRRSEDSFMSTDKYYMRAQHSFLPFSTQIYKGYTDIIQPNQLFSRYIDNAKIKPNLNLRNAEFTGRRRRDDADSGPRNVIVNSKVSRWRRRERLNKKEPAGCGYPVCVEVDMIPIRFKSLCDFVAWLNKFRNYRRVFMVQKGSCERISNSSLFPSVCLSCIYWLFIILSFRFEKSGHHDHQTKFTY